MDHRDLERLKIYVEALEDETERMTAWELGFFEDLSVRCDEYGERTQMSGKQWAALERIYERLTS